MGLTHPTKTGTTSAEPLLNEGGITITFEHIMAGDKCFIWRNLGTVRIERKGNLITKVLSPTFSLMIATKKSPVPFTFFETPDPGLAKKIQAAIDTVARRLGANKDL